MQNSNLLEKLKNAVDTEHVAFTKFVNAYSKKDKDTLYCFFEGYEDKRYYGLRIKFKHEKDFKDFTCIGKDNVKSIHRLIKNKAEYSNAKTLYFIDKDYSDDEIKENIYVTPCYSIENLYSTKYTLKEVLKSEFNISEEDEEFSDVLKLYSNLQNEYHGKLLFFNAWLSCQYDIKKLQSINTYLKIDETVKKYFESILNSNIGLRANIFDDLNNKVKLEELFENSPKITNNMLSAKIELFSSVGFDKGCMFRGKFELKLLVAFLQKIKEEAGKKSSAIFKNKHKCTLVFNLESIISTLAKDSYTPECLNDFLDKNLKVA
jgi:hypothetical protein